jgi:integrase
VNVKVVSERLGHSSVGFTLDVYAHVLPGQQAEAAAAALVDDLVLVTAVGPAGIEPATEGL